MEDGAGPQNPPFPEPGDDFKLKGNRRGRECPGDLILSSRELALENIPCGSDSQACPGCDLLQREVDGQFPSGGIVRPIPEPGVDVGATPFGGDGCHAAWNSGSVVTAPSRGSGLTPQDKIGVEHPFCGHF